jgi:hypothetical protein
MILLPHRRRTMRPKKPDDEIRRSVPSGAAEERQLPNRRQAAARRHQGPQPAGQQARVRLRQSYLRIAKRAAMMAGRYGHANQFNRHRRQLRILRSRLGRLIGDIGRNIAGHEQIEAAFALPLATSLAWRQPSQGRTR